MPENFPILYKQMKEDCMTDTEIAKELFISPATLSRWKKLSGVRAGRTVEEYKKLRDEGYRDFELALKWAITRQALYQWKNSHREELGREYFAYEYKEQRTCGHFVS